MLAIHHFDQAVEMTLKCVATKRQIKPRKKFFTFNELVKNLVDLPLIKQMESLHEVRNIIQHQGDIPDEETVIKYKGYTQEFLKEVVKNEFGISFDELSLASLIEDEELRKTIQKAEEYFKKGEYQKCIEQTLEVLTKVIDTADIFGKAGVLTAYFGASDELKRIISKDYPKKYTGKEIQTLAGDVSKAMLQLGQASTSMQFLGEYKGRFLKFVQLIENLSAIPKDELKEKAQFSLNFVIELLLKWQEEGLLIE